MPKIMARYIYFVLVNLLGLGVYFGPLKELTALSFRSELYSHFLLIPVVSIFFLLVHRKKIFTDNDSSPYIGMCVLAAGLVSYTIGIVWNNRLSQNDFLFFCRGRINSFYKGANDGFKDFHGQFVTAHTTCQFGIFGRLAAWDLA